MLTNGALLQLLAARSVRQGAEWSPWPLHQAHAHVLQEPTHDSRTVQVCMTVIDDGGELCSLLPGLVLLLHQVPAGGVTDRASLQLAVLVWTRLQHGCTLLSFWG